jgi:hypothetical protein
VTQGVGAGDCSGKRAGRTDAHRPSGGHAEVIWREEQELREVGGIAGWKEPVKANGE